MLSQGKQSSLGEVQGLPERLIRLQAASFPPDLPGSQKPGEDQAGEIPQGTALPRVPTIVKVLAMDLSFPAIVSGVG